MGANDGGPGHIHYAMHPGDTLTSGKTHLTPDNALVNAEGTAHAILQNDGNFVVYQNNPRAVVWDTKTHGDYGGTVRLKFQSDYNLVLYNAHNEVLWAAGTTDSGCDSTCHLLLQGDCNLVIYKGHAVIWASDHFCPSSHKTKGALRF